MYITADFYDSKTIPNNLCFSIYNPEKYLFSLLSCKHHLIWVKAVGGALETRLRYSNTLCYNTFPVPTLSVDDKARLDEFADKIIKERVISGIPLGKLYEANSMPESLMTVHQELDQFVDYLYQKSINRNKEIVSDSERLEVLFRMYRLSKEA